MIQYNPVTQEVIHPEFGIGIIREKTESEALLSFAGSLSIWESVSNLVFLNAEQIWRNHKCCQ